jgi:hypothetical protein
VLIEATTFAMQPYLDQMVGGRHVIYRFHL